MDTPPIWNALLRHGFRAAARSIGLVTALALVGGSPLLLRASAQPAEHVATPQAVACDVEPRSLDEVLALMAPESDGGTPSRGRPIGPRPIEPLPVGTPTNAEATAGVSATVRHLEACINAGEFFRFLALFSDDWFRRTPASETTRAELSMIATSTPTPIPSGERSIFIGPWHIEMLPDGRVLAAVVWFGMETDTCIDPNRITALIFVEQDGRWLINELIDDVTNGELIDVVGLPPAPAETALDACVSTGPPRGATDD